MLVKGVERITPESAWLVMAPRFLRLHSLCDQRWSTGKSLEHLFRECRLVRNVGRWDANFAMGSRLGEPFCVVNQCESCLSFLFYPFLYACNSTCSCITFIYRVQRWDSVDGLWRTKGPDNACHVQWHPGGLKTCPIGPSSRSCLRTARDLRHDRLTQLEDWYQEVRSWNNYWLSRLSLYWIHLNTPE